MGAVAALLALAMSVCATASPAESTVGPLYSIDPATQPPPPGTAVGKRFTFTMPLGGSHSLFNGSDPCLNGAPLPAVRYVFVNVPAAYKDGDAAPLLIIQDGPGHIDYVANVQSNLGAKLPPFVTVAVANGGGHTGGGGCGERALEYGTLSDRYARFVEREVLPAVLRNVAVRRAFPKLRFTSDASGRASMGCSQGGVAALTMAFFAPDFVTRVAAYSPAAVDLQCGAQPAKVAHPLGGREYWDGQRLIETQAKRPGMRVWVNNNEFDLGWGGNCADSAPAVDKLPGNTTAEYFAGCWASWDCDPPGSCADAPLHSFSLGANRTAAALQAAGYEYRHVYGLNQWHCGNKLGTPDGTPDVWTQTLPSTLEWMWQGYQH